MRDRTRIFALCCLSPYIFPRFPAIPVRAGSSDPTTARRSPADRPLSSLGRRSPGAETPADGTARSPGAPGSARELRSSRGCERPEPPSVESETPTATRKTARYPYSWTRGTARPVTRRLSPEPTPANSGWSIVRRLVSGASPAREFHTLVGHSRTRLLVTVVTRPTASVAPGTRSRRSIRG